MIRILCFLAVLLLIDKTSLFAQVPATNAQRETRAVEIWGKAAQVYGAQKSYSAVLEERDAAGMPRIIEVRFARRANTSAQAFVLLRGMSQSDGQFLADGKNLYRLPLGSKSYSRQTQKGATDAFKVFRASPSLLFTLAPLLSGENLAADAKVSAAKIESNVVYAKSDDKAEVEAVRLQLTLPGETKTTDLVYAFDAKTHFLKRFWLERQIGNRVQALTLEISLEFPNFVKPNAFVWKAPAGASERKTPAPLLETPASIKPSLAPEAIALLDKAVALYSGAQSLKLSAHGELKGPGGSRKNSLVLSYKSPDFLHLEDLTEADGEKDLLLFVADGKTITQWDDLLAQVLVMKLNDRYALYNVPKAMESASYPVGRYLSQWTQGTHYFQPSFLPKMLEGAKLLDATYLPTTTVNNQKVEGVRIRAQYRHSNKPDLNWEHILWLTPEGRLVRVQFQSSEGKSLTAGFVNITAQESGVSFPPQTFVFKKPAGR